MAVSNSTDRFNGVVASKAIKVPVKRATNVNQVLSGDPGAIDGWTWGNGDRILLYGQTNPVENGIWEVNLSSEWVRAPDFDGNRDATESTLITAGRSGSDNPLMYVLTTDTNPIRIGTDALAFQIYFDPDNPAAAGLQAVTDVGNTTTNAIIINPLVANTEYLTIGNAGRIVLDNVFDTGDITIGYAASTFGQIDVNGVVDSFQFTGLNEFRVLGTGAPAGAVFVMGERNAISNPLPGPIAAFATIWVRDDTPNVLVFTDDAGTDWVLNQPAPTLQLVTDAGQTTTNDIELVNSNLLLDDSGEVQFGTVAGGEINIRYTEGNELEVYDASGTNTTFKVGVGINNTLLNPEQNANAVLTIGESSTLRGNAQQAILNMYGEDTGVLRLGQIQNTGALWWFNAPTLPIQFLGTDFVMDTVNARLRGSLAGANEEKVLSFQDSGGVEYAHIRTTGTGAVQMRNVSQNDNFEFIGTYTGGTTQSFLSWNPSSHTNLKSPTGRDLQLYAGELLGMRIDNLGVIDFYYSGNSIAQIVDEAGGGLTVKQTDTGETGVFSRVQVQYDLGADGEFWFYDYSSTFMGDPTQARFRLDNADPSLATNIAFDDLTISNRDFGGILSQIQSGTQIRLTETTDLGRWAVYEATGVATDNTGWWQLPVSYIAHAGTFPGTTRDPFKFTFSNLTGAPVAAGSPSTRLVYRFEYNSEQTGGINPGTGLIHFSNVTPTSSNRMAISQTDLDGRDIGPVITDAWQGGRGAMVRMSKVGDPETYMHWVVNERSDQGTWDWTYINMDEWEGTWTDGDEMYIEFEFQPFVERPQTDHSVLMSNAILSGQPRCGWEEQPEIRLSGGGGSGVYLFNGATEIARITGSGTTQMRFTTQNLANLGSFRFESDSVSFYDKNGTLPRFSIANNSNLISIGHVNDLGNGAPTFHIRERTSQPAVAAGWGAIWVRSDTPSSLMFTADDGTDYDLTDAGATATTISAGWSTGSGGSLTIAANAPLFYTEQATADSPGIGQGQVWVRDDAPNTLMFTDDAGTDFVIGGAAVPSGITGTVADNQIVVGTGASTVDSSSELTYDAATGQLIHTHATTSLFQTGITAGVHTQITTQDNFTEIQFSDDSVDTSVARILFNINSASTGVHEYWFRDNDGTYLTVNCTDQIMTFAGRLELIAQSDHGASFFSGGCQIWAKSYSLGDELRYTAGDNSGEDFSLQNVMTHTFAFDNGTASADPGAGEWRFDNATLASVTNIYINDVDSGGRDAAFFLANLQEGDVIKIREAHDDAAYFLARVSAATTDNTGWWTIPVTPIYTGGSFSVTQPSHIDVELKSALQNYSIENVSTTPTGTTETLTYEAGPSFEVDLESVTGNITITISGGPPSGEYGQIVCKITQDSATARTVTWAGGTFRWAGGTAHPMNTTLDGFTIYTFETWDGGTTWWGAGADYA